MLRGGATRRSISNTPTIARFQSIKGDGIHHAQFGYMLKEECDQIGTECTLDMIGGEKPKFSSGEFLGCIFSK